LFFLVGNKGKWHFTLGFEFLKILSEIWNNSQTQTKKFLQCLKIKQKPHWILLCILQNPAAYSSVLTLHLIWLLDQNVLTQLDSQAKQYLNFLQTRQYGSSKQQYSLKTKSFVYLVICFKTKVEILDWTDKRVFGQFSQRL
jgi:hypothetical protein